MKLVDNRPEIDLNKKTMKYYRGWKLVFIGKNCQYIASKLDAEITANSRSEIERKIDKFELNKG